MVVIMNSTATTTHRMFVFFAAAADAVGAGIVATLVCMGLLTWVGFIGFSDGLDFLGRLIHNQINR
jgi:hypothetical protein